MIKYMTGDIFESGADMLINPVNCVGVMGKGLALGFKRRYPDNYHFYEKYCRNKRLKPGGLLITYSTISNLFICNFATKNHWRNPSNIEWIREGLLKLREKLLSLDDEYISIKSIAIPPLGCGLGGLDWDEVKQLIESIMEDVDIEVLVYEKKPCL